MAIAARLLFEDWADGIGAGYGEERASRKFVRATNMALDDLSYDSDLETNITHISSIDGSIAIDGSYAHIIFAGICYFANILGVRPADPKVAAVAAQGNERLWERLKGQYARSIDNDIQPTRNSTMDDIGYLTAED